MVILWTNLEGEKIEPSPTADRPVVLDGSRRDGQQQALSLKRRVQVALKPSLPSLFLPLIKSDRSSPPPNRSSPSSLDSSPIAPTTDDSDDSDSRTLTVHVGDLSPDSGIYVRFDPTPTPAPPSRPASRPPPPPKTLPIVYGTSIAIVGILFLVIWERPFVLLRHRIYHFDFTRKTLRLLNIFLFVT